MTLKHLLLALILTPLTATAAETDHYTLDAQEIADITTELNDYANHQVGRELEAANSRGACGPKTEDALYDQLRTIFANHGHGRLIDDILDGRMPRTVIPLKESVYGDWTAGNGFLLGRSGAASSPLALSPLIKVGGYVIGVDKLEHMFGMGYAYFRRHHEKGMDLTRVLKIGVAAEKTYLGGNFLATGVFTYADLSANFNGMRFWNHVLQKQNDVLGREHNYGPYVVCEAGRWKRNPARPIDFARYVDRTYQENYNCSKFATQKGLEKFKESLGRLEARYGESRSFNCPADPGQLEEAARKYKVPLDRGDAIDNWIINRDGNAKVSYLNEF
jgi:hypothetical protein